MLLAVDPGLANLGWSLLGFTNERIEIFDVGMLHTKPTPARELKAINRSHSEDQLDRIKKVAEHLFARVVGKDGDGNVGSPVIAVVCEAVTYQRSAKANLGLGMGYGVIAAISAALAVPIIDITPKQVKQTVTGSASASKDAVFEKLKERGVVLTPRAVTSFSQYPVSRHNHMTDSVAIGCAAIWDSPVIKTALQMLQAHAKG